MYFKLQNILFYLYFLFFIAYCLECNSTFSKNEYLKADSSSVNSLYKIIQLNIENFK